MIVLAAMCMDGDGKKRILGIAEGGSENSTVAKDLFEDLIKRGLDDTYPWLYVIDEGRALNKAINDTFGIAALIQRWQVHKKRNVLSYLPETE